VQNQTLIPILSVLIAATGISLVFKDYLASLLGGCILRRIEVGFYQRDDRLIIHGIFKVRTQEAGDVRGSILRAFLERRHSRDAMTDASSPIERG
jgi:hypothetical protein